MNLITYRRGVGVVRLKATKDCRQCGKPFQLEHGNTRECSEACRAEYWGAMHKNKYSAVPTRKILCIQCGTEFETKYRRRKFCGQPSRYKRAGVHAMEVKPPCEICGWPYTEECHIISVKDGGKRRKWNLLNLCPNHHHKFDYVGISLDELNKLGIGWLAA